MRKVVFLFGRFQVPTKGHEEMIRYGFNLAKRTGAEFRLYTSKTQDPVKNPLPYRQKIQFLHQLFPGINIVDDPNVKTAFDVCRQLSDAGIDDVTMVVGGDRVAEFQRSIGKYVMPRSTPGFDPRKNFAFRNFQVVNSGGRKAGVSGTKMREFIKKGKFAEFMKVAPTTDKALARQIYAAAKRNLNEEMLGGGISRKDFHDKLMTFVDYTCDKLGINEKPSIKYKEDGKEGEQPSFAGYAPHSKEVMIYTKNRHPMDIFRSVAHELVHHKQNEDGKLGKNIKKEGSTGSKIENEANSEAGKVMRYFGKDNPFYFDMSYVNEQKAIILAGTPGSGKDRILKESILPFGFTEVGADQNYRKYFGQNIVINGTSNYNKISTIKEHLDEGGYNTIMVFVNTSNEVSKQRNEARGEKGGRVISETLRFNKWQEAQLSLEQFDHLFDRVIEVKNDLDLNISENVVHETYQKLIKSVANEIEQFAMNEADNKFDRMLNEVGGAGNWGTPQLTQRYQKDTPGQTIGFRPMKVLRLKNKMKKEDSIKTHKQLNIAGDRLGVYGGFAKNPTMGAPFDDNASIGGNSAILGDPIGRWMVKEETIRRFKEKYGELGEQKLRETANRLRESLTDPFSGGMSDVSVTGRSPDESRPDANAEYEKTSLFKTKKRLNNKKK